MKLENLIKVSAFSKPYVLSGVKNVVNVVIEVETGKYANESKETTAYNLAIVLDRSGSMHGKPLENSKEGIKEIIKKMGKNDVLHLIQYDSTASCVFENATKSMRESLYEQVDQIESGGCTNLFAGVELAASVLRKSKSQNSKRIMLFSDGLVNQGVRDKRKIGIGCGELQKEGINFTCFGIGASYDEELMRSIAEYGKGDFFFIDGAMDIVNKINKGLSVISSLLGKNSKLTLKGKNGGVVTKVFGYPDSKLVSGVEVGDICEEDLRSVLLEMDVRPVDEKEQKTVILSYEYSFEEMKDSNVITMSGQMSVEVTNSVELAQKESQKVKVGLAISRYGEDSKMIKALLNEDKFDEAIALKESSVKRLEKCVEVDDTGMVKIFLKRSEAILERLRERKEIELAKKDVDYDDYGATIVHRKCF